VVGFFVLLAVLGWQPHPLQTDDSNLAQHLGRNVPQ